VKKNTSREYGKDRECGGREEEIAVHGELVEP
jgi:hypothetical protein